jgi:hypothetical protein
MQILPQRVVVGMLGPLMLQIFLVFLYSTIKYDIFDSRLFSLAFIIAFPLLIMHVISPFLLTYFGNFEKRIDKLFRNGFEQVLIKNQTNTDLDEERSALGKSINITDDDRLKIVEEIKNTLTPVLVKPAIDTYKDTFYSRTDRQYLEQEISSLEYYESLALFAIYSMIFFTMDLVTLMFMKYTSLQLVIITLDRVIEWRVFLSLAIPSLVIILINAGLFKYSLDRLEKYLPYVVPALFLENEEKNYLRKETIRSILSYNFDNLLPRGVQYKSKGVIDKAQHELVSSLLKNEIMVKSRQNFALSLAFREYSIWLTRKMEQRDKRGQPTLLDKLLLGERIGRVVIDSEALLGLNSDLIYTRTQISKWKSLKKEQKEMTFLLMYRLVERLIRELGVFYLPTDSDNNNKDDFNFYEIIKELFKKKYLEKPEYDILNNFRYLRNKVIHEPGTEIEVSSRTLIDIMTVVNDVLKRFNSIKEEELILSN